MVFEKFLKFFQLGSINASLVQPSGRSG